MAWDPAVLRRYNTMGHFRLLNQLRSELRDNPLIRPGEGETVATVNRSRSLIRAIQARAQAGIGRSRRAAEAVEVRVVEPGAFHTDGPSGASGTGNPETALNPGFRDRLSSIELR
jgi:hypothetical protein